MDNSSNVSADQQNHNNQAIIIDQPADTQINKQNFEDKRKLLFDSLISAESCVKGTILEQQPTNTSRTIVKSENPSTTIPKHSPVIRKNSSCHILRKESIFKTPNAPIERCLKPRFRPDYQINPHKWKKYSLDDVTDLSDGINTSAAFAFLKEIEARKVDKDNQQIQDLDNNDDSIQIDNQTDETGKPIFRYKTHKRVSDDDDNDDDTKRKSVFKGTKVLAPAYIIGQSSRREKKLKRTTNVKSDKVKELKLDHLLEHDQFDEDLDDIDDNADK